MNLYQVLSFVIWKFSGGENDEHTSLLLLKGGYMAPDLISCFIFLVRLNVINQSYHAF